MRRPSNRNVTAIRRVRITSTARAATSLKPVDMTSPPSGLIPRTASCFVGRSILALLPCANSFGLGALKLGQVLQKGPQPLDDFNTTAVGTGECQCRTASPCTVSTHESVPGAARFSRARVRRFASNAARLFPDWKSYPRGQRLGLDDPGWPSAPPSRRLSDSRHTS